MLVKMYGKGIIYIPLVAMQINSSSMGASKYLQKLEVLRDFVTSLFSLCPQEPKPAHLHSNTAPFIIVKLLQQMFG